MLGLASDFLHPRPDRGRAGLRRQSRPASAGIAQILFFVFLALFIVSLIARALRGQPPL